jgi:hypothetical protein
MHPQPRSERSPPVTTQRDQLTVATAQATDRARNLVLLGSFVSFLFSVSLWFGGLRDEGLFVGIWVPSILSLGNLVLPAKR